MDITNTILPRWMATEIPSPVLAAAAAAGTAWALDGGTWHSLYLAGASVITATAGVVLLRQPRQESPR